MRRLKNLFITPHTKSFVFCFGLVFSIFLALSFYSSSANALELEGGGTIAPQNSGSYLRFGFTDPKTTPSPMLGNSIQWQNIVGSQTVTQMGIKLSRALPNQGKNSLVSFNLTFQTHHIQKINYFGITFRDFTILWDSCYEGPVLNVTGDINATVTCTYIGLSHAPGQDFLETTEYTQIFNTVSYPNKTADYTLLVSPIYYRQVNTDSLSSSDRDWLEQQIASISTGTSQADIEQAVEDAIDAAGVVAAQNATTNAIRSQTQQQHDDYEAEVEREEAKQEELEDQSGDLSLSANSTGNPFANMFNASGCVNMPIVGGWFGNPGLKVCSPYPATIANVLNFVGSAIIVGFLIRIYYKHMNGGYQS